MSGGFNIWNTREPVKVSNIFVRILAHKLIFVQMKEKHK